MLNTQHFKADPSIVHALFETNEDVLVRGETVLTITSKDMGISPYDVQEIVNCLNKAIKALFEWGKVNGIIVIKVIGVFSKDNMKNAVQSLPAHLFSFIDNDATVHNYENW
jgi:hypothetical protein